MNLDFNNSFKTILKDDFRGDNPILDPLRFSYMESNKEKLFESLREAIIKNYVAKPLLTIDVPKSNFTIRPMGRPEIRDWIIYQSILDKIISIVVKKISDRSFSKLKYQNTKRKIDPWIKFDDKSREFYRAGCNYVVVADITSYFENIDLDELRKKVINYLSDDEDSITLIDFLFNNFLKIWSSGRIRSFGLPQGPTASGFLGDLYLDSVDAEMEELHGYIRYMDDIRIFCKSEIEARKSLIKLVKSLRKYKLNLNAKKTSLLEGTAISVRLFDPKKPILDAIQNAIDSKNLDKIKVIVPVLVDDVFTSGFSDENQFNERHLNFAIFRLTILKNSGIEFNEVKVVETILSNFNKKPHHAKDFCAFLTLFPRNKKIEQFFLEFLRSENNIYEWQELYILRALLEMKTTLNLRQIKWLMKRVKDKNTHWAIRGMSSLIIGKCGDNKVRNEIIDIFDDNENDELKRYFILAVQELGTAYRNDFYSTIKNKVYPSDFTNYVKRFGTKMYIRPYERIIIETLGEAEEKYY